MIYLPAIVMLVGLFVFFIDDPKRPKVSPIGFEMFKFGLLVTLLQYANVVLYHAGK